jgi:5-methylcytosine-specific restriction enzyme A
MNQLQETMRAIFDGQKGKCAICRFPLEPGKMHLDHIIPRTKGGKDTLNNLQFLCIPCHQKKTVEEFGGKVTKPASLENLPTAVCTICGRVFGGYTQKQVNSLLAQHMIKHANEKAEAANT